jgi:hypothetical protein
LLALVSLEVVDWSLPDAGDAMKHTQLWHKIWARFIGYGTSIRKLKISILFSPCV